MSTERRVKVDAYLIKKICACGGEYTRDENSLGNISVWPPVYYHTCNKCGDRASFTEIYPKVTYEEI